VVGAFSVTEPVTMIDHVVCPIWMMMGAPFRGRLTARRRAGATEIALGGWGCRRGAPAAGTLAPPSSRLSAVPFDLAQRDQTARVLVGALDATVPTSLTAPDHY
jgi:hypothetical protein